MLLRTLLAALCALFVLSAAPGKALASPNGKTFVLFHKTWCVGEVSPLTSCDVSLGGQATTQRVSTSEPVKAHDPIDALRQVTHESARTTAAQLLDLQKLEQRLNRNASR